MSSLPKVASQNPKKVLDVHYLGYICLVRDSMPAGRNDGIPSLLGRPNVAIRDNYRCTLSGKSLGYRSANPPRRSGNKGNLAF
jgi:hypothetical protein